MKSIVNDQLPKRLGFKPKPTLIGDDAALEESPAFKLADLTDSDTSNPLKSVSDAHAKSRKMKFDFKIPKKKNDEDD